MELNLFHHISKQFEDLSLKIDKLVEDKNVVCRANRSSKIDQLGIALSKAQGEFRYAHVDHTNPYYDRGYSDLKAVVEASRLSLSKYGLSVVQVLDDNDDGECWLQTILVHGESDQWIASYKRVVPLKNDIQSFHSHVTYLRRVAYASLVGVVLMGEDDDGEKDVATHRETFAKGTAVSKKYDPKKETTDIISRDQLDEMEYELSEYPDIAEDILDSLQIQNLADIPKSMFRNSINRVRAIKNLRNGKK